MTVTFWLVPACALARAEIEYLVVVPGLTVIADDVPVIEEVTVSVAVRVRVPALVLTGSAGYESDALHNLFQWSSRSWLLGPLVGTMLNLPLLDGGRNKQNLAKADANYESLVANYRQQVLLGFQDVEDNLSALRTLDN